MTPIYLSVLTARSGRIAPNSSGWWSWGERRVGRAYVAVGRGEGQSSARLRWSLRSRPVAVALTAVQTPVPRCQGGTPGPSLALLPAGPQGPGQPRCWPQPHLRLRSPGSKPEKEAPARACRELPPHTPLRAPLPEPISGAPTPPLAATPGEAVGSSVPHGLKVDRCRLPCLLAWSSGTAFRLPAGHMGATGSSPAPRGQHAERPRSCPICL